MADAIPTAGELLEAVKELLRGELIPALDGRLQYNARVAANVLAIVGRELDLGPALDAAQRAWLAQRGRTSVAELASAIRGGEEDAHLAELVAALHTQTRARLSVENPRYIAAED